MSNQNEVLIREISIQKDREQSEDRDNLLRLTSRRLYGEKIHYALELIQNAEDENSTSVIFIFNSSYAAVINDGKVFDKNDVWRICSVKTGQKKKKIGFFGIGFKSVFNITSRPQIISDGFNFEIEKYIYPIWKNEFPVNLQNYRVVEKGSIFVLPYSQTNITKELIDNFNQIDERILLFLENLKEIKFEDNINNNFWAIKKELKDNSILSLLNTRTNQETNWKVFNQTISVLDASFVPEGKEGIKETQITIAYPQNPTLRELIRKNGVVYCYLPTKKRTDLPFLIQADFLPTIGRENIAEEKWNFWLMEKLGTFAAETIEGMRDNSDTSSLYEFIPLSQEVADSSIRLLYEPLMSILKKRKIAKSTKDWILPSDCIIPKDQQLRQILSEQDLKLLYGRDVFFADAALSERACTVLTEMGAEVIGPQKIVDLLQLETTISKKTEEWFLSLYDYLRTVFDTSQKNWDGSFAWDDEINGLFEKLLKIKFILTDENKLISIKEPAQPDRFICYPERIDLTEVHQLFTEGEIVFLNRFFQEATITRQKAQSADFEAKKARVKDWFDSIGVRKYFKQTQIIRDVILLKFSTGKYSAYSDAKIYDLINYIRSNWSTIQSEINNKKISANIIDDIRNSVMLKCFYIKNGEKVGGYLKPNEAYFSDRYSKVEFMEELFHGIELIPFVSPAYLNREKRDQRSNGSNKKAELSWKKFFEILGVWSSPRVVKEQEPVSITGSANYDWIEKERSPQYVHEVIGDSRSQDIERLIQHCSALKDPKSNHARMKLLWSSLEKYWTLYKENYCKCQYKWLFRGSNYRNYDTTTFLEFLRGSTWVPGQEYSFYKPNQTTADTKENRLLLGDEITYISLKADEAFFKDLNVRVHPELMEVLEHLKHFQKENQSASENSIEKMSAIYSYFNNIIKKIVDIQERNKKINYLKVAFNANELLYLPREDQRWWKPSNVFWKDYAIYFETIRGYVQHDDEEFYASDLKEFFLQIGVVEKPLIEQSFDILEELKVKNIDFSKRIIPKIYSYIEILIKQGLTTQVDWNKNLFLSEKGLFLNPSGLFFNDNDEYGDRFGDKLEILWLPFSWDNIEQLIKAANIGRLSTMVTIHKKLGRLDEIEGSETQQILERISYLEPYLQKKKVELYNTFRTNGLFEKISRINFFVTSEISLDYVFNTPNSNPIVVSGIKKDSYLSFEENRLYKTAEVGLLSTAIAKELSKLYPQVEDYVFPVIDSLFGAHSDEELRTKLKHFGLSNILHKEEKIEKIRIIPSKPEKQNSKKKIESKTSEKSAEGFSNPEPADTKDANKPSNELINADDYEFDTIEELDPYIKTDGTTSALPGKVVKLKSGYQGGTEKTYKNRQRVGRTDAESTAIEIVRRVEEMEGRVSEDRHSQPAIGYDIYSKTNSGDELFIEVKHFRGVAGTWGLTPHQYKKAETVKERYFVYIVSDLLEGSAPKIEIIQNPTKYLTLDPPIDKKYSWWKNGVKRRILFQKHDLTKSTPNNAAVNEV